MLDRNINSIIYQSYIKLGDLAYQLSVNAKAGLEGTKQQNQLWDKAIAIFSYLDVIGNHIVVLNNEVYKLRGIEVYEMNKLLTCLKEVAEIYDYPVAPFIPVYKPEQITIGTGSPGNPGTPGQSAYFYLAFASDGTGTDFSATPSPTRPFVAFRSSITPLPFIPTTFTGLWVNYIGSQGPAGTNGTNGTSAFIYVRYAFDNAGSDFSATPSDTRDYIAILQSPTDLGVPSSVLFNGLWVKYQGNDGTNGTNGTNGKTIIVAEGAPNNSTGQDGDTYIDKLNFFIYTPKLNGMWPAGVSIVGPPGATGAAGANGTNGTSAYLYMAWADDANGNGFTLTFDQDKDWIAYFVDVPGLTVVQSDFDNLWSKYQGDGDRWATTSVTSVTLGTGVKNFVVGLNLAYTTGQRVVIAVDGDEDSRMEGYVRSYDPTTGQLIVDVELFLGLGTYNVWDVNLFGVPVQILTTDSYFGEIYVEDNSAGTPQSLNTTYAKITQFDTVGSVSPGVNASHVDDNIQPTVRGAYIITTDLSVSCDTAGADILFQLFENNVAIPGAISRIKFENNTDVMHVSIITIKDLDNLDTIDIRAKAGAGTPTLLVQEGRLSLATTGSPGTPDFTTFINPDVDTGTETVDAFDAMLAYAVEWDVIIHKGTNRRKLRVGATWEGTNVAYDQYNAIDLGTIDVTLIVEVISGDISLRAVATSDDWVVSGNRTLIK
jgi:hypothetical protein